MSSSRPPSSSPRQPAISPKINHILMTTGGVHPTSSATTNNRFIAFPADIALASEEKKIFKVAKDSEEFSKLSEKEKTRIKLERGAAALTIESVSMDLKRKRNAAAARLRREMLQREGIPLSLTSTTNNTSNHSVNKNNIDDDKDNENNDDTLNFNSTINNNHQSESNPETKEKMDQAVINSMNFPLHCDDDDPKEWKGPPIEFLEEPEELNKAERDAQDRARKQHDLNHNGKYWLSVYATNSKKPNPKLTMIQRQLLQQQEQNEKKPGILTGRKLPFEVGEAEFIARKNAKTEASIRQQIEDARRKKEEAEREEERQKLLQQERKSQQEERNRSKSPFVRPHLSPSASPTATKQSGRGGSPSLNHHHSVSPIRSDHSNDSDGENQEGDHHHHHQMIPAISPIRSTTSPFRQQHGNFTPHSPAASSARPSSARSHQPHLSARAQKYEVQKNRAWLIKLQKEKELIDSIQSRYERNEEKRLSRVQAVADRPQQILNERVKHLMVFMTHVKFVEELQFALRKKKALNVLKSLFTDPVRVWIARRKELKKVLKESRFASFSASSRSNRNGDDDHDCGETDNDHSNIPSRSCTRPGSPSPSSGIPLQTSEGNTSNDDDDDDCDESATSLRDRGRRRSTSSPNGGGGKRGGSKTTGRSSPSMMNMNLLRASFEQNLVDARRLDATFNPFSHTSHWDAEQLREMKAVREEATQERAPLSIHELLGCSLARGLVSASSMEDSTKKDLLEKLRKLFVPVWTPPQNEETEKHRDAVLCPELENAQDYLVYVRRGHLSMRVNFDLTPDSYAVRMSEASFESKRKQATAKFFEENPKAAAIENEKRKQAMLNQGKNNNNSPMMQTATTSSFANASFNLSSSFASASSHQQQQQSTTLSSTPAKVFSSSSARTTAIAQQQQQLTPKRPQSAVKGGGGTARASIRNAGKSSARATTNSAHRPQSGSATARSQQSGPPQHPMLASLRGFNNNSTSNNSNQQQQKSTAATLPPTSPLSPSTTTASPNQYLSELSELLSQLDFQLPKESGCNVLRYSLPSLIEMQHAADGSVSAVGHFLRHLAMIDLSNYFPLESFPMLFPNPKMELSVKTETRETSDGETEWIRTPRLSITAGAVPPLGFFGTRRCVFEGKGAASASQYECPSQVLNAVVVDPATETHRGRKLQQQQQMQTNSKNAPSSSSSSSAIPQPVCEIRSGDRAQISYSLIPETSVDFFIAPIAEAKKIIAASLPWYIVARQVELMKLLGVECTLQSGHSPFSSAPSLAAEGEAAVSRALEDQTSSTSTRMSAIPRPADVTRFTFMAQQKTREALISLASETALLTQQDWSNEANWLERITPHLSILETIAQRSASVWNTLRREDLSIIKNLPVDRIPTRYTVRSEHGEFPARYLPHSLQDARRRAASVWNDLVLSALESVHRLENGTTFPHSTSREKSLDTTQSSSITSEEETEPSSDDENAATITDFSKTIHRENKLQQQKKDKLVEEKMKNIMSATFEKPLLNQYNGMNSQIQSTGGLEIFEPGTTIKRRREKNSGRALVVIRGVVVTEDMKEENGHLVPIPNSANYYFRMPTCLGLRNDARIAHALFQGMRRQFNFPGLQSVTKEIERNGLPSVGCAPLFQVDPAVIEARMHEDVARLASIVTSQSSASSQTGAVMVPSSPSNSPTKASSSSPSPSRSSAQDQQQQQSVLSKPAKHRLENTVLYNATYHPQGNLLQNNNTQTNQTNNENQQQRLLSPGNLNPVGPIPVVNAGTLLKHHPQTNQSEVIFAKTSVLVLQVPWKGKLKELMVKHGLVLP